MPCVYKTLNGAVEQYRLVKGLPQTHECLPAEVIELTAVKEIIAGQLDADREMLRLKHSLGQIPDGAPPDETELAVLDGEERLKQLDRRIRESLRCACRQCPSRATCPARMT